MGGQCPGAPDLKGSERQREKGENKERRKGRGGGPRESVSTGPERPRYATVPTPAGLMLDLKSTMHKMLIK